MEESLALAVVVNTIAQPFYEKQPLNNKFVIVRMRTSVEGLSGLKRYLLIRGQQNTVFFKIIKIKTTTGHLVQRITNIGYGRGLQGYQMMALIMGIIVAPVFPIYH